MYFKQNNVKRFAFRFNNLHQSLAGSFHNRFRVKWPLGPVDTEEIVKDYSPKTRKVYEI